jgi:hypothetical protein
MTPDLRSDKTPVRVQIPAYTDAWMQGDRFGVVVRITRQSIKSVRAGLLTRARRAGFDNTVQIAHVLMDKSNRIRRVILDDCEVVS